MFDLNKIKSAAERLGLDLEFNSENPGIQFITTDGSVDNLTFGDLQISLNKDFKENHIKSYTHYNLENKSGLQLNIKSNCKEEKPKKVNEIIITVDGHSKVSNHNYPSSELDASQYMFYGTQTKNEAV